jgi:hypothetical protein
MLHAAAALLVEQSIARMGGSARPVVDSSRPWINGSWHWQTP